MKPIRFKEASSIFGINQPDYLPLPTWKRIGKEGVVISCWYVNWRERLKLLFTGKVWSSTFTFNKPLQPQRLSVDCPSFEEKCSECGAKLILGQDFLTRVCTECGYWSA